MQQTACLVVNLITLGNFAFLFNCMLVGRTSDPIKGWDLLMRWLRPDVLAVIRPTGVYLLGFFCFGIQFMFCWSLLFALSPFYILIYMFWEMMHVWVRTISCKPNIYVSWSSSLLRMRLVRHETSLSPPVKYFTYRSKTVLLLWIICVIYVFCLSCFCVCSLLPCGHLKGKGWHLGSRLWSLLSL